MKVYKPYGGSAPKVETSETSSEAAASIEPVRQSLRDKVHAALIAAREQGVQDGGYTDAELEALLKLSHQTASARRRELVLLGVVVDSGHKRKTPSGRNATVWRAIRSCEQVDMFTGKQVTQTEVIRDKLKRRISKMSKEELATLWSMVNEVTQ